MAKLGCFLTSIIASVLLWQVPFFGPLLAVLAFFSANTIGMVIAAWVDRSGPEPVYFQNRELLPEERPQQVVQVVHIDARSVNMNHFHGDHEQHEPKHISAEVSHRR
jgi:uncharacterized protein YodC (DUF2158 family)